MTKFEASDFSLELPDEALDVSSYCFSFPALGEMPPNLTITAVKYTDPPVLEEFNRTRTALMRESLDNFAVLSENRSRRDNWDYIVSTVRWTSEDVEIRQKRVFIHVPESVHTIYSLVATDLAGNAEKSDPAIDGMIRSFQPIKTG